MKFLDYDKTTGAIKSFYDLEIHRGNIPEGCAEITDKLWQDLLSNDCKFLFPLGELQKNTIELTLEDMIAKPEEVIIVNDKIDPEKVMMAEALADLYERILLLEGGII